MEVCRVCFHCYRNCTDREAMRQHDLVSIVAGKDADGLQQVPLVKSKNPDDAPYTFTS